MRILRDNGLTIALLSMFVAAIVGMVISGQSVFNSDQAEHGAAPLAILEYMTTGAFQSALFENWESEFLQMASYVVLTAYLFQRGSAESRDPDKPERGRDRAVRTGWLYAHSLGVALGALFVLSFLLHWLSSAAEETRDSLLHGHSPVPIFEYITEPQFWFESFQNWQSEFLSTAVLVVLSIFLRYRGSPES